MTELSLTQRFERLFEPAARAARQGDPDQIREVLGSVRAVWKRFSKRKKGDTAGVAEELARGMAFAIEGILGIVLASAGADARQALLEGRKHALPVLHALGKQARARANDPAVPDASLQMSEIAKAVGVLPQNLGELIDAMRDCGLVKTTHQGQARRVTISDIGVHLLEAAKPGWQLMNVDQDLMNERIEESVGRAMETFA
jgi:DNA-binding MarR family transcriptional regulator